MENAFLPKAKHIPCHVPYFDLCGILIIAHLNSFCNTLGKKKKHFRRSAF